MPNKQIPHRLFSSQYKLIRTEKDYHLGQHLLMRNSITKRRAIVKNHEYENQQILSIIINDYNKLGKMHDESQNLCGFLGYCLEQKLNTKSINLIYDYHQNTLQQQIASMTLKNQRFTEKDLDCFIICVLRGLISLQKIGFNHTCLKYSNILIQGRNTIDLVFRIFYTPYLTQAASQIKQNRANVDDYNLSQKQLQILNSKQTNLLTFNKNSQDAQIQLSFQDKLRVDKQSLGLMALRMATFNQCKHGIYNIDQRNQLVWDIKEFKSRWDVLSRNYSKELVQKIHYLFSQDKTFYSFKQIPNHIITRIPSSNQSTQNRVKSSAQKSFYKESRSKSPVNNDNQKSSSKKFVQVSGSRLQKIPRQNTSNKVEQPNFSAITRLKGESLQNSKSSMKSMSPSPFEAESPNKKGNIYEGLKAQIQSDIFPKIPEQYRKSIKTDDGSDYIGGLKSGLKEGYGICYFKQGDIYAGQWKKDQIQGTGTYLFQNCDIYNGQVQRGLKHGRGKYIYSNGNIYQGQWRNDKKDGFGIFTNNLKNEKYQGQWTNGNKQGHGIYKWKNGDKYEGGFSRGLKSGNGVATKFEGTRISGQWYNDNIRGRASIKFRSGSSYTGEIKMSGNSSNNINRLVLEGNDCIQISGDGTKYQGSFSSSKRNGYCKIQYNNGDIFEGNIRNNKFEGEGTYYYNHLGCSFTGQFASGLQTGKGFLQFSNGSKIQTEWTQGKPGNKGKITYANGDYYQGQINRLGRNGKGVYNRVNGQKIQGYFKNGVLVSQNP